MGNWLLLLCIGAMPLDADNRIEVLVRQLGDTSYRVREAATRELLGIGSSAKPALQKGLRTGDPEIQQRCEWLLPRIMLADLQARIQKFIDNPDDAESLDLPGFRRFHQIVGDAKSCRELYIDLVRQHGALIERIESDPTHAAQSYREFSLEFANRRRVFPGGPANALVSPAERADIVAFFLLGADSATRSGDLPYLQVSAVLRMPAFTQAIHGRDVEGDPLRKLFVGWAAQQTHATVLTRVFTLANTADIKEVLPLALKHLQEKQAVARTKGYAALVVGKHGTKDHIPQLEALFDDQAALTTVNLGGKRGTVEMRDVALAMCIQLAGEQLADYGYDLTETFPTSQTSYYRLGFTEDAKRQDALKRWRERAK